MVMKKLTSIICSLVLVLTGCDRTVLEFPEGEGVDPTLIDINLSLEIDPQITPYVAESRSDKPKAGQDDVRWIIEVFRDEIGGEPVARQVLRSEQAPDGVHKVQTNLQLHAALYHVVAWMDYVDNGALTDKYYTVNSLSSIKIPEVGTYIGNEDGKAAYITKQEVDLRSYSDKWNGTVDETLILKLPMAKIEFITTDIDKFLDKLASRRVATRDLSDNPLTGNLDLTTIQVSVEYAGYFPSGFNAYTNKPNDACLGMSFGTFMTPLTGKEARLASDYIFVNGSESAVKVNLIICDAEGNLLNEVHDVDVPIVRGRLTTIRDEFLTRDYAPGIGIDPGFDGEIDIIIPD